LAESSCDLWHLQNGNGGEVGANGEGKYNKMQHLFLRKFFARSVVVCNMNDCDVACTKIRVRPFQLLQQLRKPKGKMFIASLL
jgi:hypothetical protein